MARDTRRPARRDDRRAPRQEERRDRRPQPGRDARESREEEREPPRQETRAVATTSGGREQLPAEVERLIRDDAGAGLSTKASDNLIPLLYVLQPLSPQALESNPAYVSGAQPGDFWLKNSVDPIVPGDEGVYFQPAHMYQEWVEWVPRKQGGGFVGRYPNDGTDRPPIAEAKRKAVDPENPRKVPGWSLNGNDLVDTRYVPGHLWRGGRPIPFVIPFKSTGHSVAKGWMSKQNSCQLGDGTRMPAWANLYELRTVLRKNAQGEWYAIEVGEPISIFSLEGKKLVGGDSMVAYGLGKSTHHAFVSGEKQAAPEEDLGGSVDDEDEETGDQRRGDNGRRPRL